MSCSFLNLVNLFDIAKIKDERKKLNDIISEPSFWDDPNNAQNILKDFNLLNDKVTTYEEITSTFLSIKELMALINEGDESFVDSIEKELNELFKKATNFRRTLLFTGEYDESNAYLTIHPGAGGVESQDWASMLYRMYTRFAERHKYNVTIIDMLEAEEAGIKSVKILVEGKRAYGLLKGEKGVHRLVRVSPFDSSGRRHTSFASVNVVPEFKEINEIPIKDEDLRIDTYRSGGAGGQNVNKVETAVRITHLPTGIVVSSQAERSQNMNKQLCMRMLQNELYALELTKQKEKISEIVGKQKNIEWGNQIRSYVLFPYTLIKDHRTNYQESDVNKVLDGDIDNFIYKYLEMEANGNERN